MSDRTDISWWKTAVAYQIYPRSFADSDGDGIGDLPGVIDHLDHLVDLGVGAIWMSPFFSSPQRDIGYDVSDYRDVAPEYGTLDDAQRLIDEAHARGLRVLLDLVLNHTSDEHPWFVESRASRDDPKADWYVWADGRTDRFGRKRPPNNWRSELQFPSAWQWGEERQQWYLATFLHFQPDLNWRNPELRAEMFDTVRTWLARGVDGFRLDIFGSIMQDEQLRDNDRRPLIEGGMPRFQTPNRTLNTPDNIRLAGDLREVCDEFEGDDRVLLGEVFGPSKVLRQYLHDDGRDGLHLVFLFGFLASPYSANRYRELISRFEHNFPAPLQPTYVLENHDRARSLSRVGGSLARARVLATLLCTLRGVPVIYQGQEIGMTNRYIPIKEANDPVAGIVAKWIPEVVNKRLPERFNRDEVRTPMQWEPGPGAGFCPPDATPWLPINENHTTRNVATEATDLDSLFTWYQLLLRLRKQRPALHGGTLSLTEGDGDVLRYDRDAGGEAADEQGDHLTVIANLGSVSVDVAIDGAPVVLAASAPTVAVRPGVVTLPPDTAVVLDRNTLERGPA